MSDVVVIGAGLAGLTAALRLARSGRSVMLVTKGPGGLQLSQGTLNDIPSATPPSGSSDPWRPLPECRPTTRTRRSGRTPSVRPSHGWPGPSGPTCSWVTLPATTTCPRRSAPCAPRRWRSRRWWPGMRSGAAATRSSASGS